MFFLQKKKFFKSFISMIQFPHGGKTFLKRTLVNHPQIIGCLRFELLREYENKHYKYLTKKDNRYLVFIEGLRKVHPIDETIINNGTHVFISRDPRIIWYLCNNQNKTVRKGVSATSEWCKMMKRLIEKYKTVERYKECKNYLHIKYEDILNPDTYVDSMNKIMKHAKIDIQYLKPFHELRCKYFNAFDVRSRFFRAADPKQDELDCVSIMLKYEIKQCGYPEYFDKEEIEKYRRMYNE